MFKTKGKVTYMARQPRQKGTSLTELSKNRLLFSKVITMIDKRMSYDNILNYLASKDIHISKASLTNLKKKLEESRETGIAIEVLLDRRTKKSVKEVKKDSIVGYAGTTEGTLENFYSGDLESVQNAEGVKATSTEDMGQAKDTSKNIQVTTGGDNPHNLSVPKIESAIYSMDSVMNAIIAKGINQLNAVNYVDFPVLLKTLELYHKTHDTSKSGGLTVDAIQQLQLIYNAKIQALMTLVLEYIPEDKQDQALEEMDRVEAEFMANIEVQPAAKDLLTALKNAGVSIE